MVGRGAYIIAHTGKTADVQTYNPDYESMQIPIVDAALQYDDPHDGISYMLIIRNALHVPSMNNHLIPPFLMREAGIIVHDTPKIHLDEPSVSDHSIYFEDSDFRIPLSLSGVFSFLPTTKPSSTMLNECEDVYMLTPSNWNPHNPVYSSNERNMLDWQGNMKQGKDRQQILLADIRDDVNMSAASYIGLEETQAIEELVSAQNQHWPEPTFHVVPEDDDQIASVLSSASPVLNDCTLYKMMEDRCNMGKFQIDIGLTTCSDHVCLAEDIQSRNNMSCVDSQEEEELDDSTLLDILQTKSNTGEFDLDDIMVSAVQQGQCKGVDKAHLAKI